MNDIVTLGQLMKIPIRNGVFKGKEFLGRGVPLIKMGQLFASRFLTSRDPSCELIELNGDELERFGLERNDLVFSRTSVVPEGVGLCSIVVDSTSQLAFESNLIRVRLEPDLVNPEYVFRFFQSSIGRASVVGISNGVAVRTIRGSDLKNLEISLPDRITQDLVVHNLRAYDDLIENNRRRIKLLEEAARLIYREWFVRLRFPGHDHAKVVDGSPDGWSLLPFSAIAGFVNGYAFKPGDLLDHGMPVIKIPELKDGVTRKTPFNPGDAIPKRFIVEDSNLLFSWSGTLAVNYWVGKPGLLNQHLFKVTPNSNAMSAFLYLSLNAALAGFENATTGATMKHIRRSALDTTKTLVATDHLMSEFAEIVEPIFAQVRALRKENILFSKARDLLLPRLMSGEIKV